MATPEEIRSKFASLTPEERERFKKGLGGLYTDEWWANSIGFDPNLEPRVCYALGLLTEEQKMANASADSAVSARHSAIASWIGVAIAVVSAVLSLIAIYVSVLKE